MKIARIRFKGFFSRLQIEGLALIGMLVLVCLAVGCGSTAQPPPPVAVTVSPNPATVALGATQTFTASVTGTNNPAVTWSVQEGGAGGSIDNTGLYTAPPVAGTYHVIATSVADPTKSGSATVKVPVAVTVNPSAPTVFLGAMQMFTAAVAGTTNMAVTWTVQEGAAGGSITNAGVYTAPQVPGTYHVIATSVADTTKSGTATITVPPFTVTVNPLTPMVLQGATQQFTATVTATNMAVTWTIQEAPSGGSIDSTGLYTAPPVAGTYHVIATSVADPTKSGSATVTVPPVGITISPTSDTLGPSGLRNFVASVTGTINTAVTWSIEEGAAGGTVDTAGHYTAPTTQGTFHVVAISVADPTKTATATVTVVQSGFLPTGGMTTPRWGHTATLLNTGKALAAGGVDHYKKILLGGRGAACESVMTNKAELFDPATGSFTSTGSMTGSRVAHTATLLQDGKVLVAGGFSGGGFQRLQTAEIFDPATATFTPTGNMLTARDSHTATLLASGRVLVAGGAGGGASAELFDPATGSFTSTGSMTDSRANHTATLLQTGKVLVAGGSGSSAPVVSTAELYDPAAGTFSPTGSMETARIFHTATLLSNGTVLITGGSGQTAALTSAEIYNPVTGMFTPTGSMNTAHTQHTASLLQSGKVLVAGGGNFVAELFDPSTGTFSLTGSMFLARTLHTATVLPSGDVVVAGSLAQVIRTTCIGGADASAELYH